MTFLFRGREPRRSSTASVLWKDLTDDLFDVDLDEDVRHRRVLLTKFRVQLETLDAINRCNRSITVATWLAVGIVVGAVITKL